MGPIQTEDVSCHTRGSVGSAASAGSFNTAASTAATDIVDSTRQTLLAVKARLSLSPPKPEDFCYSSLPLSQTLSEDICTTSSVKVNAPPTPKRSGQSPQTASPPAPLAAVDADGDANLAQLCR